MIFFGALRKPEKAFIIQLGKEGMFDGKSVQIIGSGSFTFEQILKRFSPKTVFGNDISLLSVVIGNYLVGRMVEIQLKDAREAGFFKPYVEERLNTDPLTQAATVLSTYHYTSYFPLSNLYKVRRFKQELPEFDRVFDGCVAILKKLKENVRIDDFVVKDGTELVEDKDKLYIWHLPFDEGDSYLKDYRLVNAVFDWDAPEYRKMTAERNISFLRKFVNEGYEFLFFTSHYVDDCKEFLVAKFKYREGDAVYVYGRNKKSRTYWAKKWSPSLKEGNYPLLPDSFEFSNSTNISFKIVKREVFNYYRELFIAKDKVRFYSNPSSGLPILLFADCYLFGFLLFVQDRSSYRFGRQPTAFLLSDFRVISDVPKLSKLVVMLAKAKEFREIYERIFGVKTDQIMTAVYTEKPVSMKYERGAGWRCVNRAKRRFGDTEVFYLTYRAPFGEKSLKEEYLLWLEKHYRRVKHGTAKP